MIVGVVGVLMIWLGGRAILAGQMTLGDLLLENRIILLQGEIYDGNANELVMKLLARQDPHPALFEAYALTLPGLVEGSEPAREQAALRAFELLLLRETGLLPDLSVVTLTLQPLVPQQRYVLVPEAGVMAAREEAGSLSGEQLLQLQAALQHDESVAATVGALQRACLSTLSTLAPLRSALRLLLHYHAGTSTLRTRLVMQGVQNLIAHEPTRRS